MTRLIPCLIALMTATVVAAEFAPPQAYPRDRYEAGWQKNPFTLKTAPPAVQPESFAKDLALSSISGSEASPVVVVVNTKTRERTTLRGGEAKPADQTMIIKSVHSDAPRKERYVEVEQAGQVAKIFYDENLIKVAGAGAAQGIAGNAAAGRQGMAANGVANQPGAVTPLPGQAAPTGNRSTPPVNYAKLQPNLTSAAPGGMNPGNTSGAYIPPPQGFPGGANPAESAPTVQRRKFVGVPQPPMPAPQPVTPVNP